jgi:hypothetical protein
MAETAKPVETEAKVAGGGDHDRVAMASRLPDGTPHQTADFEYIGDKDVAIDAAKRQLAEQAVSAVDVEHRGVGAPPATGEGSSEPDPGVRKLKAAQDKAAKAAESSAEREVNARHHGLGDR